MPSPSGSPIDEGKESTLTLNLDGFLRRSGNSISRSVAKELESEGHDPDMDSYPSMADYAIEVSALLEAVPSTLAVLTAVPSYRGTC